MRKMLFIYNPKSGKGLIRNSLAAIVEEFSREFEITIYATGAAKDGERITGQRAEDFDVVACSGGDGTLDEIITGLMRSGIHRTVGYIPSGSTNDFANSLGIPKQMEQAAKVIVHGEAFTCDLGKFNQDYFVYVAAFGLFTDVSYQTSQDMKNMLGHAAYLLEAMKRMGTWKSNHLSIQSEEFSEEGEFVFGMITNSNSVGGIKGVPWQNVELNDGYFEVMLVRTPQSLADWQEIITAVIMKDTSSDRIVMFKSRKLEICAEKPVAWTLDGENGGEHREVTVENLPHMLEILVPARQQS